MNKPILLWLFVLMLIVPIVAAELAGDTREVFDLLRGVNLEQTYDDYSSFIDLILYLLLFVPLSLHTLGRHFEGRHGRMVSIAVGLMLSLGLFLMESTMGFDIRSFGPLAALLLINAVGFIVFLSLRRLGTHTLSATCTTIVLVYSSLQAVSPGVFDWFYVRAPWLSIIVLLCVVVLAVRMVRAVVKALGLRTGELPNSRTPIEGRAALDEEGKNLRLMKKTVQAEFKDARKMIRALDRVKSLIRSGKSRKEALALLQDLRFKDEELLGHAQTLRVLVERIKKLDVVAYERLKERFAGAQLKEQRKTLKASLLNELEKLRAEAKLTAVEEAVEKNATEIHASLKAAAHHLEQNEVSASLAQVDKARDNLLAIQKGALELRSLEKKLQRLLAGEEYLQEKRAA